MYSAQALADGLYTASDLPSTINVDGVNFARSGTTYGNTTNGVILEANKWAKYNNGSRSRRDCLVQSGVEDPFANTYAIYGQFGTPGAFGFYSSTVIVNRISTCVWSGNDGVFARCANGDPSEEYDGARASLMYYPSIDNIDGIISESPGWVARWEFVTLTGVGCIQISDTAIFIGSKNQISTPIGNYTAFRVGGEGFPIGYDIVVS
jgi:hypothetical protein